MEINKELIQINQLPIAKADIEYFAKQIEIALKNGEVKASDILLRFKAFEKVFENIKSKLIELAVKEISLYPKSEAIIHGAEFKVMEAGTSYIYEDCNDDEYNQIKEGLEIHKEALKDRENFLKALKGQETIASKVTGEIINIYPPSKKSSTIVQVKIK